LINRNKQKIIHLKIKTMKTGIFLAFFALSTLLLAHQPNSKANIILAEKGQVKNFSKPDEVREFPKGKLELVKIGNATIGRATFQPGWKWSESLQPLVKTNSCEAPHFQYHVSGTIMVKMDDGTVLECKPGDVSLLPMGHDAWVVGNKPAVVVDFQGMLDYAKAAK
jgi:hypothetical protein